MTAADQDVRECPLDAGKLDAPQPAGDQQGRTHQQIFINLPVADLARSMAFFTALGYAFDPQSISESAACITIGQAATVMLMTQSKFNELTPRAVCDTSKTAEVLFNLTCASRQEVDELAARAVAAGGTMDVPEDFGFMFTHGFTDPDGHGWGLVCVGEPPSAA